MSTFRTVKLNPAALQGKGLDEAIAILAEAMVEAKRETDRILSEAVPQACEAALSTLATKEAAK